MPIRDQKKERAVGEEWATRKSLVMRAKAADDAAAWDEFVKYYERFIFHLLHGMNVPMNDFDDLVQTVLVKLWKSLASFDHEKARFRTWLSVVVRNAVWDYFAEGQRRGKLMDKNRDFVEVLDEAPPSEIEARIEKEWVQYITELAMERIQKVFSGEAVNVFTMSLEDVSADQIAKELNLKLESVWTLKSRVKARFIKEVKALMDELEG